MTDAYTLFLPETGAGALARRQDPSTRTEDVLRATSGAPSTGIEASLNKVEAFLRDTEATIRRVGTAGQRTLEAARDLRRGAEEEGRILGRQARAVTDRSMDQDQSWFGMDTMAPGIPNGLLVLGGLAVVGLGLVLILSKGGD